MTATTDQPITIRPARIEDAASIAHVQVKTWQATYRGIVPDTFLDTMDEAERTKRWATFIERSCADTTQPFVIVAVHAVAGIIGYAAGGRARSEDAQSLGELYALYVLPLFQRRGIGRQLVAAFARELLARGWNKMVVVVLEANPACGFYEALGGQHVRTQVVEIGGVPLAARVYEWPDLSSLTQGP